MNKKSTYFIVLFVITSFMSYSMWSIADHSTMKVDGSKKWKTPNYRIVSSVMDPSLDQQHALFQLEFSQALIGTSIEYSCNGVIRTMVIDSTLKTTVLVSPGKYQFMFYLNEAYAEIITDSIAILPSYKTCISVNFSTNQPKNPEIDIEPNYPVSYKPVIYTYSPTDQEISIQLKPNGGFTYTYPNYGNSGWKGIAHVDGSMTINGTRYPYLFWEGLNKKAEQMTDYSEGFLVKQTEVTAFLEDKLTQMGLNDKEKTDFITFWGPRMVQTELGFVQFLFNEDYNQVADITISPAPAEIFRVYMLWTPLENTTTFRPQPQKMESVDRTGFYVIEWGGSELQLNKEVATIH